MTRDGLEKESGTRRSRAPKLFTFHFSPFTPARRSRAGFTLIEMLIVVVVLVTLMSITFRLSSVGEESDRRVATVTRMQKLENCLSGYNAAFGSYPPVAMHGSHDVFLRVGDHGIQTDERNENIWDGTESEAWEQVQAACKAQPVACRYPFPDGYKDMVAAVSDEIKTRIEDGDEDYKNLSEGRKTALKAGFDDGVSSGLSRHASNKGETDWRKIQLFQFGLMSYLLPRYLFMLNVSNDTLFEYSQWSGNNTLPCDPFIGSQYSSWKDVKRYADQGGANDLAHIANIPSQAACARWMPNLEGMCECNHAYKFFGISIRRAGGLGASPNIELFSPSSESSGSTSYQYILDGISVQDGWDMPFYYYSPAPYQTYTLWSGGANRKTFPPWISRKSLPSRANERIASWTADDIIHMSN